MNSLVKFFWKNRYQSLIFLLSVVIFITNYKQDTYLAGWDSLQTELNPVVAIKRALFASWQEYQSFGLVGGMGHASDIVRSIFTWLLSFILPQNMVRYFFHIFMFFLGGLGSFTLFKYLFKDRERSFLLAFLGSLFYMFNLGTIQIFNAPFEAFSVFFAALPWEIWIFIKMLTAMGDGGRRDRNLIFFFLINLLATPQAYVQTLFIVYVLILGCITLGRMVERGSFQPLRKSIPLFLLIAAINLFWILPQLYFVKNSGKVVANAKINQLATEDVYYQNLEKGNIPNFLKFEGFYFDLFRSDRKLLFLEWKNHMNFLPITVIQYIFASVILLGLFRKNKWHLSFGLFYIFIAGSLLNAIFPFSQINDFLRQNSLLNQVFRSPFTKFIIPYALVSGYLFVNGVEFIRERFIKNNHSRLVVIFLILLAIYSLPVFQGHFFSNTMKVKIPSEYTDTINYFKTVDKSKRIAFLPDQTFWGWFYTRWGYNGSGFLWYGVEQPIVSRTFDVWSDKSESYFWQIKTATEAENQDHFEKLLDKYNIDYLIVDRSLLPVSATLRGLQYDRLNSILSKSNRIKLLKKGDVLELYKIERPNLVQNFVTIGEDLPNIGPQVNILNLDTAYINDGLYKTDGSSPIQKYYPFHDIISQTRVPDKKWNITDRISYFILGTKLEIDPDKYNLTSQKSIEEALLYKDNKLEDYQNKIPALTTGRDFEIQIPKRLVYSFDPSRGEVRNCGPKGVIITKKIGQSLQIESSGGSTACIGYDAPFLEQQYSYLIEIKSENIMGRKPFFYILDNTKRQSFIEDRLESDTEYYILNPKFEHGRGYVFVINSNSYKNLSSISQIKQINIYLFPFDFVKNLAFLSKSYSVTHGDFNSLIDVKKKNYYSYEVHIDQLKSLNSTLILYQSYDPGWRAYLNGKRLDNHFTVNGWANGWKLPDSDQPQTQKVKIIFLPQYLEYAGFFIMLATFLIVIIKYAKSPSDQKS